MRRVLQQVAWTGLLATGLASTQALAQDTTDADTQSVTDDTRTEPQTSAPAAAYTLPVAPVLPAAPVTVPSKPKVGDMTTSGYFRGGWGGSNQKGRMTCFGLGTISGGLRSKYRLGNECEQWGEFHISTVVHAGDDGTVGTFHFMPTVFIPTSYIGYTPNAATGVPDQGQPSTGAVVMFPNLYADLKGISWLFGGTAWVGTRYYKRESVYISDFFYWNPSGVGAGIEDIALAKIWDTAPDVLRDLTFSYGAFAVDGPPKFTPFLPLQSHLGMRNDFQLRGIRPWQSGELQLGFQYIHDWSNQTVEGAADTNGGWGVTVRFVQKLLGGDNKLVFQYGKGGGTGFGTLAAFFYPDFSLVWGPAEWRLRILDVITVQPLDWLGAQLVGVYQRDNRGTGADGALDEWYSVGGRVSLGVLEHLKLLGEAGFDQEAKTNGAPKLWLAKLTGALALAASRQFVSRHELRLFYTYATWSEAAARGGIDSGRVYTDTEAFTNLLSGAIFGLQAEAMW